MTVLSVKVGETYTTRNGDKVRITSQSQPSWTNWNPFHKFNGSNGEIYRADGRCGLFGKSKMDLVAESKSKLPGSVEDVFNSITGMA